MRHPSVRAVLVGASLMLGAAVGLAQPEPKLREQAPVRRPAPPPVPALETRLAALRPDNPAAYYELGEEVAGEAVEPEHFALARQLYVTAYELDRAAGSKSRLGPSICLGLAKIERLDEVRDWLKATAGTLDPRYVSTDWNVAAQPRASDQTALRAAEVLGLTRSGDGLEAMAKLDQPGVRELLVKYEPLLSEGGAGSGLTQLETQMRQWPCPECKNRRYVTRLGRDGPEVQICSTCNGNPGPELTQDELIAHLRFESRLLSGLQRSWSAQAASDFGAPLLDPDPAQLGATLHSRYGVVLGCPYWRDGRWTDKPDVPAAPPSPPVGDAQGAPQSPADAQHK